MTMLKRGPNGSAPNAQLLTNKSFRLCLDPLAKRDDPHNLQHRNRVADDGALGDIAVDVSDKIHIKLDDIWLKFSEQSKVVPRTLPTLSPSLREIRWIGGILS